MAKPLVSVCMITAQTEHPMLPPRDRLTVYDLFRRCLANQTYTGPIEAIVADANQERLSREFSVGVWRAERVVHTRQVMHDRTAISGARNTCAAYARGDLLVFLDDCTELLPSFIEAAVDLHERGKIPTRLYFHDSSVDLPTGKTTLELLRERKFEVEDPAWQRHGGVTDRREIALSGNACGVFVVPRKMFLQLNGFDENFDGNWGCEDIEFWTRLDRLKLPRVARADLAVVRWAHGSTPGGTTLRRCREAYAQWAYRQNKRLEANRRLSDDDLDALKKAPSCHTIVGGAACGLCTAPDRSRQIDTYRTVAAEFDLRSLSATYGKRPSGLYLDSWR
jgi:hypothetical protein